VSPHARFAPALEFTLSFEGGYVDAPDDPGGRTRYGITARDHPDAEQQYRAPFEPVAEPTAALPEAVTAGGVFDAITDGHCRPAVRLQRSGAAGPLVSVAVVHSVPSVTFSAVTSFSFAAPSPRRTRLARAS
jgi:lysozyme family protein